MTDRIPPIFLVGRVQKDFAKQCIDQAPGDFVCTIKKATRREEQSEKFHAMCGDVARQCKYMSRWLTKDQWKVLFISGHAVATGIGADVVPGLEGEFTNIRESSAQMSISRMASVIEYVAAYGADKGVVWSEPKRESDEEMMNRRYA
ncbi:NinB protein [Nitrosospira sp. Nl5]|uniref:recombination protein NinB n=1 Tax=Nitrosospira sp. Nl5 TaxID=200120 RepID=UPI000883D628|nr:recombination protein NinB [Nitrosospira sp. Nl5]SCX93454.1 NinB protein [Nitrosospira sp. Nl5]